MKRIFDSKSKRHLGMQACLRKLSLLFAISLSASSVAHATSISLINPTIQITLTDILVGGLSAIKFQDYENGVSVYAESYFTEDFLFGGTGSTSGSSGSSLNSSIIPPGY